MDPEISIVIPLVKETKNLPLTLIDLEKHLSRSHRPAEALIASVETGAVVRETVERFSPFFKNLVLIEEKDRASAVKESVKRAKGRFIVFASGLETSLDPIDSLIDPIEKENFDFVSGLRREEGKKFSVLLNRLIGLISRVILAVKSRDPLTPINCYSREAGQAVFSRLKTKGGAVFLEARVIVKRLGLRSKEIKIQSRLTDFSLKDFLGVISKVATIRLQAWLGAYGY